MTSLNTSKTCANVISDEPVHAKKISLFVEIGEANQKRGNQPSWLVSCKIEFMEKSRSRLSIFKVSS